MIWRDIINWTEKSKIMQEHKGNIIDVHLNILIENKFKFVTNSLYNNTISVASLTLFDLKK